MKKKGIKTATVLSSILKEEIVSRLPSRIRHRLFVLFEKPLVLKSVDCLSGANRRIWEKSRTRWINSMPDSRLTWGIEVSGDNFVRKISSFNVFDAQKIVLEVGPGKGRILKSLMNLGIPYRRYFGIDISAKNIAYLRKNFTDDKHNFIVGDIETIKLENFDILLSSLTFKHLFPSFKQALVNISKYMNPNAVIFFDLPEGKFSCFHDGAYIRWYSKPEISDILKECNLKVVLFDHVIHVPWHKRRLLVAAAENLTRSKAHNAK
jgi:SAM-dependent methyltransferase